MSGDGAHDEVRNGVAPRGAHDAREKTGDPAHGAAPPAGEDLPETTDESDRPVDNPSG